jgi:SAM-dependent methyltransferase
LDGWLPHLVAAWRRLRGSPATGALTADERRDVVAGAARLTRGLTGDREFAGARYFDDTQLLGAYLLLYWPVSYAQAQAVLPELRAPLGDVLDVGSGPGPLALAALDAGATSARAIDRVPAALAVAKALASEGGRVLPVEGWDPSRPLPAGPFDTILAGHVINELYGDDLDRREALVQQLLARLAPGGCLVIIEPALRETSRALLQLRDRLVARGASVRAPCMYRGDCPALVRPADWCHAEQPWVAPPLVEELAQAAKLHRDSLKMTYLVLQPPGAAWPELPAGRLFRIVSEPLPEKGKRRFIGCGPEGRIPLVLPDKHVRDDNRVFVDLRRGDVVRIDRLATRGDGLRLDDQSEVHVVSRGAGRRS